MIWVLVLILGFMAWGLSNGQRAHQHRRRVGRRDEGLDHLRVRDRDDDVSLTVFLIYTFFVAVAAGMAVIQDDERKIGEILHATPLTPREYVWGKFLAVLVVFAAVLVIQQLFAMLSTTCCRTRRRTSSAGPFSVAAYLVPALAFGLPTIVFTALTSFAVGLRWRKPILVFVLPVAMMLVCGFFLWDWSPTWLAPALEQAPHGARPGRFPLAQRDAPQGRPRRGVLQHSLDPVRRRVLDQPPRDARASGLLALLAAERHFARTMRGEARGRGEAAPGRPRLPSWGRAACEPGVPAPSPRRAGHARWRAGVLARRCAGGPRRAARAAQRSRPVPVRPADPAPDARLELARPSARSARSSWPPRGRSPSA